MNVVESLYTALNEDIALSTAVSGRIFPRRRPLRAELPAVTFFRVQDVPFETHSGCSLTKPLVQVTAWATTALEAESVATLVRTAVRSAGQAAIIVGGRDDYDAEADVYSVVVEADVYEEV